MKAMHIPSAYVCGACSYTMHFEEACDAEYNRFKFTDGKHTLECRTSGCAERGKKYLLPVELVELQLAEVQ